MSKDINLTKKEEKLILNLRKNIDYIKKFKILLDNYSKTLTNLKNIIYNIEEYIDGNITTDLNGDEFYNMFLERAIKENEFEYSFYSNLLNLLKEYEI